MRYMHLLIIDQRYRTDDMERVIQIIKEHS